jgi:hypothetical protein
VAAHSARGRVEGGGATFGSSSQVGRRPGEATLDSAGEAASELGDVGEVALSGGQAGGTWWRGLPPLRANVPWPLSLMP